MKTTIFFLLLIFTRIVNAQWQNTNAVSPQMNCVAASGTKVFAGRAGGGVEGSLDNGSTWTICCYNGMTFPYIWSLMIDGTNVFATTTRGLYISTDNGANWTPKSNGISATTAFDTIVQTIAKSGTNLFAGTAGSGIYLSTNYGNSWSPVNNGLTNQHVQSIAIAGTNIFAGTAGGGIFLSTNNGANWTAVNSGLTNGNVKAIAIDGGNIYAGTSGGGIFLSTNNGSSWTAINNGLVNLNITAIAISSGNIYLGTLGGVYVSTDNGTNWTAENSGFTNTNISGLSISGTNIFASVYLGGIWRRALSEMVGINEIDAQTQLKVFPNPLTSQTTVQTDIPLHNATLNIENCLGVTVKQILNLNGETATINRDDLATGFYFITLIEDNKTIAKRKIIISD